MTLARFLEENKIPAVFSARLCERSAMRCGGRCAALLLPESKEALSRAALFLSKERYPFSVVGRMTNTLPSDTDTDAVLLSTERTCTLHREGDLTYAEAGVTGAMLSRLLLWEDRLSFAPLVGIPGTVGGAVRGNAGAFGRETSEVLFSAEVLSVGTGAVYTLTGEALRFSYRHSLLKEDAGLLLLSALYKTPKYDRARALAELSACAKFRRETQPCGLPSLGSIFLRAEGRSAGYYIERVGLKGFRLGGAEISSRHAGFIVNRGSAYARDVIALIALAKARVRAAYRVSLTPEITVL